MRAAAVGLTKFTGAILVFVVLFRLRIGGSQLVNCPCLPAGMNV